MSRGLGASTKPDEARNASHCAADDISGDYFPMSARKASKKEETANRHTDSSEVARRTRLTTETQPHSSASVSRSLSHGHSLTMSALSSLLPLHTRFDATGDGTTPCSRLLLLFNDFLLIIVILSSIIAVAPSAV